ncbi:MAG: type I-U CRISPR-associated protein Csb2 [Methanotrichaceae archaeon]|jgi:CRISPR-associated protein Csb2
MSGIGSMDCDRSLTNGLKDQLEAVPCAEQEETRRVGPTLARFAVASMDAPRLTETISLAEKVHSALVSRSNGSPVFTGCDESGIPLKGHSHAYIFCESNVGLGRGERGEITHITVYASSGFGQKEKRAIEGLTRVWGHGLDDLQLVLLGVGQPEDFAGFNTTKGDYPLFAMSKCWVSRTPFVPTRHPKATRAGVPKRDASGLQIGSPEHDLRRLLLLDGFPSPISVVPIAGTKLDEQEVAWYSFLRRRETGEGKPAANGAGYGFRIEFPEPVSGPVVVGYGAHFGMGEFVAEDGSQNKVTRKGVGV